MWHSKYNHLTTPEQILFFWLISALILSVNLYVIISIDKKEFLSLRKFIILVSRTTTISPVILYSLAPIFSILSIFNVLSRILEVIRDYINDYISRSKLP